MIAHPSKSHVNDALARLPLMGPIFRSYAAHYDRVDRPESRQTGEKLRALFARWALNFSADYYEAK